jgi:hypothetical protein
MGPLMAHTNACGEVSRVVPFTGTDVSNFLGARRVVASKKELKAAGLWEKTDGDDTGGDDTGGDDAKAAGTAGAVDIAPGKPEDTVA